MVIYLNFESRKAVYHSFIMSIFNFCPLIWHFCSNNIEQLEKINFRALKFVFQDFQSIYEEMITKAGTSWTFENCLNTFKILLFSKTHCIISSIQSSLKYPKLKAQGMVQAVSDSRQLNSGIPSRKCKNKNCQLAGKGWSDKKTIFGSDHCLEDCD